MSGGDHIPSHSSNANSEKICFHYDNGTNTNETKTTTTASMSNLSTNEHCLYNEQIGYENLPVSCDNQLHNEHNGDCICHHTKSVQILTPTKSEQVLFDPKMSAASLFSPKMINDLNGKIFDNKNNNLNTIDEQQLQQQHRVQYCKCNPEQVRVISVQICLNCEKPIEDTKQATSVTNSPLNDLQCDSLNSDQYSSLMSPLITEQAKYQTYPVDQKLSCKCFLGHKRTQTQDTDANEECVDFGHFCLMEDSDDEPKYCKKCNVWFGSLDPSYPYRCNCHNANDTINTNDSLSVYSINMRKDFRYVLLESLSLEGMKIFFCFFLVTTSNIHIFASL